MTLLKLLDKPEKWIKRYFAMDKHGGTLPHGNCTGAVSWCLRGAIQKCYAPEDDPYGEPIDVVLKLKNALNELYPQYQYYGIASFNNLSSTTFAMIRRVIRKAKV